MTGVLPPMPPPAIRKQEYQRLICQSKIVYDSRVKADKAASVMKFRKKSYHCDVCGKFHLTTKKDKK